jgi:hypothetical protein
MKFDPQECAAVEKPKPADGKSAAAEKKDFGTSRWQLSNKLHRLQVRPEVGAKPSW